MKGAPLALGDSTNSWKVDGGILDYERSGLAARITHAPTGLLRDSVIVFAPPERSDVARVELKELGVVDTL